MSSARRIGAAALVAAGLALLTACAPARTPADVAHPATIARDAARQELAERSQASTEVMETRVGAGQPGCSAAVGVHGEVVWAGAAGLADLAAGIPVTTATRFDMASVSKQFTATAILVLQREGLLNVADPVGRYVDDLPWWGESATLDQLIHHTSRIPDYWVELDDEGIGFSDPADQQTTMDAIRRIDELEPGEGYFYSNTNYVLLAEVIARVTGQALPDFLRTRFFEPLGLDMVLAPTLVAPDIALSYDDTNQLQIGGWTSYGHTGIISTPSELVRWGDQYRAGDLIQDDFAVGAVDEGAGELYAAGMDIEVDGDLNHTGRMGGYITDFTISEDRETTIAVMCNGHAGDRFGIAADLWAIWRPTTVQED